MTTITSSQILEAAALTRDAFAAFGDVIETDGATHFPINGGRATRYDDLARVDATEAGGVATISIFRSEPMAEPVTLHAMERHPLASQAIIPIDGAPYLVVVAPAGPFDPAALCAFIARPGQGINYHRGVWHHPLIALRRRGDFLVVDRKGDGANCDIVELDPAAPVSVAVTATAAARPAAIPT